MLFVNYLFIYHLLYSLVCEVVMYTLHEFRDRMQHESKYAILLSIMLYFYAVLLKKNVISKGLFYIIMLLFLRSQLAFTILNYLNTSFNCGNYT